jgi:arylsulfatase A-like enzyme
MESIWYPGQKKLPPLTKYRNGKPEREEAYVNDAMAKDASAFIRQHQRESWFLYVPFLAVHEPLDVPADLQKRFAHLEPKKRPNMAALTWSMDQAVGTILAALRESGLDERTLVVFLSDNGSYPKSSGSNGPLRGSKGTLWEGGIRIPFIVRWQGRLPVGKTYTQPVIALDLLPTMLAAAGVKPAAEWKLDGTNLLPYLKGETSADPHDVLFWRYGDQMAVRAGQWKLVKAQDETKAHLVGPALYNLTQDIGESNDLAAQNPKKVQELTSLWQPWNAEQARPLWGAKESTADSP